MDTTAITVEVALAELREMFPKFGSRMITFYDPEPGSPYITICLAIDDDHDPTKAFTGDNLPKAMSRVRAWRASQ